MVTEVEKLLSPRMQDKKLAYFVDIHLDVPQWIRGSQLRIRQVLVNLMSNAVKFTARGSVGIHIKRVETAPHTTHLRFEVQDTGIGIDPEHVPFLFQPFKQVDASTSRQYGGTGLGLSICKRLVSLMSGQIGVISNPHQGSTFWFEVPMTPTAATALASTAPVAPTAVPATIAMATPTPSQPVAVATGQTTEGTSPPSASGSMQILLVEDNAINQALAQALLKRMGHAVTLANNGQEALQFMASRTFDAVLMDCQMPVMDGFEATRQLRAGLAGVRQPDVSVIAMTANAMVGDRERCLDAGMNDYVAKPIKVDLLKAALERAKTAA
jgi:hypothetical protein